MRLPDNSSFKVIFEAVPEDMYNEDTGVRGGHEPHAGRLRARAYRNQYLWSMKRFKKRPDGEKEMVLMPRTTGYYRLSNFRPTWDRHGQQARAQAHAGPSCASIIPRGQMLVTTATSPKGGVFVVIDDARSCCESASWSVVQVTGPAVEAPVVLMRVNCASRPAAWPGLQN